MIGRMVSVLCVLILTLLFFTTTAPADDEKITPIPVTGKIFMIAGKGGNIGVFCGEDGTFLIDDQFAPLTEKIVEGVKSVGGDHPKFLINTHYHGDHTGGNENLGGGGTLIFSHDNVRERLSTGSFLTEFNMKGAPLSGKGLPVVTFSEDISFHLNGDSLHAKHTPFAHTDGDSFIKFKAANVIHTGDIFFNGFYPFIDVTHGGSLKGMIMAVDAILSVTDDSTKIIPGHGPPANKEQLVKYRQMLGIAFERLRKLKAEGKTAREAAAAKPLADLEAEWGDGLFKGDRWIEIIYSGV